MAEGAAARRAGLRAVVTKALAGGLAAYLCVRERETLRLRSILPCSRRGPASLELVGPGARAASAAAACLARIQVVYLSRSVLNHSYVRR